MAAWRVSIMPDFEPIGRSSKMALSLDPQGGSLHPLRFTRSHHIVLQIDMASLACTQGLGKFNTKG